MAGEGDKSEWLDAANPPPVVVKKGGFLKTIAGVLGFGETSEEHLKDLRKMPGVSTEITPEGKHVEVSVNTMVPPEK